MSLRIRALDLDDPERIAGAFEALGWRKPVEQYERYLAEQAAGARVVLVAEVDDVFAGYLTVVWSSPYPPFRERGVPEVQDFSVLPAFRRRGVGTALMDAAETLAGERTSVLGIGVGMDPDYGAAQAMYVRRGYVPDARGLTSHGRHVTWGDTVKVDDDLVLYFTKTLRLPPMVFPERTTRRLVLRPVRVDDALAIHELYSNAEVCEFLDILPYEREEQAREHVRRWARLAAAGRQSRCAIELDGKVIGTCGLYSIERHQNRATLGCDLHPDYWTRGIMTEALTEFLAQCFGAWSFTRIQALVLPGNRASIALLRGLGFAEEGLLRSYEIWEGRGEVDLMMYAKVRS
jgi:RimJ/RimL family protein N-acetyltransferase